MFLNPINFNYDITASKQCVILSKEDNKTCTNM